MYQKAMDAILKFHMLEKGDTVIAGVSGGADSAALLHFLSTLREKWNLEIKAVHVNHGLRGEDAKGDAEFVADFCASLGIELHVADYDIKREADKRGVSEEEAGRLVRYQEFDAAVKRYGADKIAVAHNRNDQAETVLLNLCRGSAMKGLGGIAPVRDNIIRPLILCGRKEIENYCAENHIAYRTDATNFEETYTRNKIRLRVFPYLEKEINPKAVEHIADSAALVAEENAFLEKIAQEVWLRALREEKKDCICLDTAVLSAEESVIRRRVFGMLAERLKRGRKNFTRKHMESLEALLYKETGTMVDLPYGYRAYRQYGRIRTEKKYCCADEFFGYNIPLDETIYLKEAKKYVRISLNEDKKVLLPLNRCTKAFDYDKIKNDCGNEEEEVSFQVRNRLAGDRISLKGIAGSKKVKDYFIDEKVPREKRGRIPIVTAGGRILWIAGMRACEEFLAGADTKRKVWIEFWED